MVPSTERVVQTTEKLRQCMARLKTANDGNFPWAVRLQLMSEASVATCESQVETSEAMVRTILWLGEVLEKLESEVKKARPQ